MTIRARIFIVFMLAIVAGFSMLGRWINNDVKTYYNESYEEILVDTANVLAELVAQDLQAGNEKLESLQTVFAKSRQRQFSARIYAIEKNAMDLRVYVTDQRGRVIFDSDDGRAVGEDYSQWRDVYLTLRGQYGARTSNLPENPNNITSEPVSVSYVGAPVTSDGVIIGVVSVGKPKTNIEKFVTNAKKNLLLAVIASVLFALLLALLLYLWVSKPLQALVDYAEKVSRGERAIAPLSGGAEIRKVGEAMAAMRQALENKQYVETYIQTLTHEIKSPLTAIKAAAELLGSDLPDNKRLQFSNNIIHDAERLNDFANRLLQLAALERKDALDTQEPLHIGHLIDDVSSQQAAELQKKNILMTITINGDDTVYGDVFLLRQAIENLLRNAIDFSPEGSLITINGRTLNDTYEIAITDQGSGIPAYALEHVFDRFYSLPRPSGKKSTGLGLNLVREVAELHQGSVHLENRQPAGVCAVLKIKKTPPHNLHTFPTPHP